MPVEVSQKCIDCHRLKPRSSFPVLFVGRGKNGKPKRTWRPYCKECELIRLQTGRNPDKEPPDKLLER